MYSFSHRRHHAPRDEYHHAERDVYGGEQIAAKPLSSLRSFCLVFCLIKA
jgi:hypothetical protein